MNNTSILSVNRSIFARLYSTLFSEYNNPGNFVLVNLTKTFVSSLFTKLGTPVPDDLSGRLRQKITFSWVDGAFPQLVWPEGASSGDVLVTGTW